MPFIPDFLAPQNSGRQITANQGSFGSNDPQRPLRPEEHEALSAYHSSESDRHKRVAEANSHDREYSSYHRAAAAGHYVANPAKAIKFRSLAEQKQLTQQAQAASDKADNMEAQPIQGSPNWITELPTWQSGSQNQ